MGDLKDKKEQSLGDLNDKKEQYVGNSSMAQFMETNYPELNKENYNSHTLGTFFEAAIGFIHLDSLERANEFFVYWKTWVDKNVKKVSVRWLTS